MLPKCRFCSRTWRPVRGVLATESFCNRCVAERHAIVKRELGLHRISKADKKGPYILAARPSSSGAKKHR